MLVNENSREVHYTKIGCVLYVGSKLNLQYHVVIPDQAIALDA